MMLLDVAAIGSIESAALVSERAGPSGARQ
jgi:hypothetical protein